MSSFMFVISAAVKVRKAARGRKMESFILRDGYGEAWIQCGGVESVEDWTTEGREF